MTNVIIYLVATIGTGIQIYGAVSHGLWWAPGGSLPLVAMVGVMIMGLGTAWSAVKGSSAAWIVFVGALLCWAFYVPGLGTLLGDFRSSISAGRLSIASAQVYLPLLPPALLAVATVASLTAGPLAQSED
jgi:hypothetical protein